MRFSLAVTLHQTPSTSSLVGISVHRITSLEIMLVGHVKNEDIRLKRRERRRIINISRSVNDQGACFSPLPFESFGLAGREVLDLVSSLVKKASESLNIDFALLLSYWKKRISTTLQVYTAKFILEASHQCQRETPKEDKILWIVLCSKYTMFE